MLASLLCGRAFKSASAATLLLLSTGCIASNVVTPGERMVAGLQQQRVFESAPTLQLDGLFESVDIQGDAAASLRKIYYLFSSDGSYTAAALAEVAGKYSFQTLDGTWQNDAAGLVLDGGDPVTLEQSGNYLRLLAASGLVVLVRKELL
ncbi:MAG: hypothetical protein ACI85K_001069 [Hyphomicrobiaceae bacterium]|jgi:hypothetical protein